MQWNDTAIERFVAKVQFDECGCWLWTGAQSHGYGVFLPMYPHGTQKAHRFAYEYFIAPIPQGLELDHLCRTPGCVNPAHLEPVTHRANLLRGDTYPARNARATACPAGHPYDEENTMACRGERRCRACNRIKMSLRRKGRSREPARRN